MNNKYIFYNMNVILDIIVQINEYLSQLCDLVVILSSVHILWRK